eukprot:COSAG02_NODE_4760_length_5017_cov_7.215331_5_plen_369_part_00
MDVVVPGSRLRCVKRSAVRTAAHLHSDRVGFLEAGSEITALDVQASDAFDAVRVRYLQGWVSTKSATGAVLLELMAQSSPPPVSSLDLDPSESGPKEGSVGGSDDALGDLLGAMRHMETVLHGASVSSSDSGRAEAMERASHLLSEASYGAASEAFEALLARDPRDESAQRGLRQAEKGLRLTQQIELEEWFSGLGLLHFAQPMAEQGYESLAQMQDLSDAELHTAQDSVGMTGREASTFVMALRGVPGEGGEEGGELLAAAPSVKSTNEELPRGLLARAQSTGSTPIAQWTRAWDLADSVDQQLQELGVETVGDLQALDADDIADLRRPLKKVQSKKFVQALAQALDDIERETVEQELNRAHEVRTC